MLIAASTRTSHSEANYSPKASEAAGLARGDCLIPGVYRIPSIVRRLLTRPRTRTCHLSGEEPLLQRCLGAMDITQIVRQLRCYSEDHGLRLAKVDELQPTAKELLCSLSEELELIR